MSTPEGNPKSAMEIWMTPVRWANGEFSAHFSSRGKAKNCRAWTAPAFGVGVFRRFGAAPRRRHAVA